MTKSARIDLLLTPELKAQIIAHCKSKDISVAQFLRELAKKEIDPDYIEPT